MRIKENLSIFLLVFFLKVLYHGSHGNTCPSGYEYDTDTDVCYVYVGNKVDWETAAQECDRNGSHMPSIHSQEENSFVLSKTFGSIWLGLHYNNSINNYTWQDGSLVTYQNWASSPGCVFMDVGDEKWKIEDCSKRKRFFCVIYFAPNAYESGKNALQPEYSCVYHLMGCYKYYSKENWEDAKAKCKSDGTHLNLIRSQDDNTRLQSFITNEVWLGLGNDDFNTWVDGNDVSYQNWRFEHPDDFQCVIMINSGGPNTEKWRKVSCRHTKHYFCVKQPRPPGSAS